MSELSKYLKKYGLIKTIKAIIVKVIKNIIKKILKIHGREIVRLFKELDINKYEQIIIFENHFGFDTIMKQRPQQVATNFDDSVLFLYHSNKNEYAKCLQTKKIKKNVYVVNLDLYRKKIIKTLKNFNHKYIMIYSTDYVPLNIIDQYVGFDIIYEYVDDIDEKLCGLKTSKKLITRHNQLLKKDNIFVTATATKLYNNIKNIDENIKLILNNNACDYETFNARDYPVPKDMEYIKKGKYIIGYHGALASWFDYNTIKKLAENKTYEIVLIGLDYDKTLDKSKILELDNVNYLGKKEYADLPKYLNNFTIGIIPFIINEITLSTSPVKIFEYMAALKPIVTTDMPECRKYPPVYVSKNHEEFIDNVQKAIENIDNKKYLDELKKCALENTWDSRCREIKKLISHSYVR